MTSLPTTPAVNPLTVDLDAGTRLVGVRIHDLPDTFRSSAALDEAVRAAVRDQLASRREPAEVPRDAQGHPVVRRAVLPPRQSLHDLVSQAVARQQDAPPEPPRPPVGGERGVSDNECVEVVLDPGGEGGELTADPGWLRNARPDNVAAAISQAFRAAYEKRDNR